MKYVPSFLTAVCNDFKMLLAEDKHKLPPLLVLRAGQERKLPTRDTESKILNNEYKKMKKGLSKSVG